jgi:PhnB protein
MRSGRAPDESPAQEPSVTNPMPPGYHTLTPSVVFKDCKKAIEFYKKVFGAKVVDEMPGPDGRGTMHASVQIGDSMLMMGDESPGQDCKSAETLGNSPVTLCIYVPNVDEVFKRALANGAKQVMPVADMFWGDRAGNVKDPFGNGWMIATHQRDPSKEEIQKGAKEFFAKMGKG